MGTTIKADRRLDTSYDYIQVMRSKGNASTCGFGVRTRDDETSVANSYMCIGHAPVAGGAGISYVRFMTSSITDGTVPINISVFYLDRESTTYTRYATEAIAAPLGNWQASTEYFRELASTIYLKPVTGRAYYLCIDSLGVTFMQGAIDSDKTSVYVGAASGQTSIDSGDLTPASIAVSFEGFGEPTAWPQQMDGGAIDDESEDWFGTEVGDWTDMSNIEVDDANVATAGGEGTRISVDLADGQVASGTVGVTGDVFPDYDLVGIRAVSSIHIKGTIVDGTIGVFVNEADTVAEPSSGWVICFSEDSVGAFDITHEIPRLARWVKIVELGESVADTVQFLEVNIVLKAVTDGNFFVNIADAEHILWVENYPVADLLFKIRSKLGAAVGELCNPFTNRKYVD